MFLVLYFEKRTMQQTRVDMLFTYSYDVKCGRNLLQDVVIAGFLPFSKVSRVEEIWKIHIWSHFSQQKDQKKSDRFEMALEQELALQIVRNEILVVFMELFKQ